MQERWEKIKKRREVFDSRYNDIPNMDAWWRDLPEKEKETKLSELEADLVVILSQEKGGVVEEKAKRGRRKKS
jgi:hypothetical protein